jgi:hypothetical protein
MGSTEGSVPRAVFARVGLCVQLAGRSVSWSDKNRMKARWTQTAGALALISTLIAGSATLLSSPHASARGTLNAPASATPTATAKAHPKAKVTPTPIKASKPTNPTPIPSHRKVIMLPKPVVLVVGTKTIGTGLAVGQAFVEANNPRNLVPFRIAAPTKLPAHYALQLIDVTPAQDQQTPAAVSLLYIPAGLKKVSGTYPSFVLYKQLGPALTLLNPGGKVQLVTINAGKNGVGVIKGQLVDQKFRSGLETVEIAWQVNSINYELTSVISLSKLSIKTLLATAGSFE